MTVETVASIARSESASHLAHGFVRGNPLWNQLAARGIDVDAFEAKVVAELQRHHGDAPCCSPLSAHVLTAVR